MTVRLTRKSASDLAMKGFEQSIAERIGEYKRSLARLEAIARGELRVTRVRVKSHDVPKYHIAAHWRYVPTRKTRRGA